MNYACHIGPRILHDVNETFVVNIEVAAGGLLVGRAQSSHLISSETIRSQSVISSVQSTNDHRRSLYVRGCSVQGKGTFCEAYHSRISGDSSLYQELDEFMNQSQTLATVA